MTGHPNQNNDKASRLPAYLLAAALLLAALCGFYTVSLKHALEDEAWRYVGEVAERVSTTINTSVSDTFDNLHAMGDTCVWLGRQEDPEAVIAYLTQASPRYGFLRMGIVELDGMAYTTAGTVTDLSGQPCVQEALRGADAVSGLQYLPEEPDTGSIIFAVPLRLDGKVIGALAAASPLSRLRETLDVESFSGEGFTQVIQPNGNFIFDSSNKNAIQGYNNYFTLLSSSCTLDRGYSVQGLQADIAAGRPGTLCYTTENGVHKVMNYMPLAVSDWYMLCVVPTEAATARTERIIHLAAFVNVAVAVLFLALIVLIIRMNRKSRDRLTALAYTDPVTGGHSRQWFEQEAAARIAAQPAGTYALVSADIRQFKLINDAFGSQDGNRTLRFVYRCIEAGLQPGEFVCRIAADTFNLLLRNAPEAEVAARLAGFAHAVNAHNNGLEQKYYLPLCAGVYVVTDPSLDLITIQDRANVARKQVKRRPDSRLCAYCYYTDQERLRMLREKEIDNRKEGALQNHEFVVYLQPKVSLEDGTVAGAEALVRWCDPVHGMVSPGEFIPAFEKNGFIVKLDRYVFEEVCRLLRRWIDMGKAPVPISVNLSRRHLDDPHFLDAYAAIFQKYGLPPKLIEIELTETLVLENLDALIRVIGEIHKLGFTCSLDDFGSGYSSLNILKDVPADVLKLDRAFFEGDMGDSRTRYIVESVLDLAKRLHMRTVSEGVETVPQVRFLADAKCDMVQGFAFARPMPAAEFEKLAFDGPPLTPHDATSPGK